MATRKTAPSAQTAAPTRRTAAKRAATASAADSVYSPLAGRVRLGGVYEPSAAPREAMAAEIQEPRPQTTGRYPHISNAQFDALKAAAPKAARVQ